MHCILAIAEIWLHFLLGSTHVGFRESCRHIIWMTIYIYIYMWFIHIICINMYIPSNANVRYIMMMLICSVQKKTTSMVHVSRHVNIGFKSDNSLYGRETPRGSVADVRLSDPGSHGLWYAHAIAVTMPPCRLQEGVAGVAVAGCMGGPSRQYQPWTTQLSHNRVVVHSWTPSWAHHPQDVPQEFLACQWVQGGRHTHRTGGWLLLQEKERLSDSCCGHAGRLWCDAPPFGGGSRSRGRNLQGSHGIGLCTDRVRFQPDDGETLAAVAQKVIAPLPFTVEIFPFRIKTLSQFWVSLWQPRSPFFLSYLNKSTRFCPNFCITCRLHELTEQVLPFHLPMSLRFSTSEQVSPFLSTKRQGCGWLGSFLHVFAHRFVWKYGAIDPSSDTSICEFPFWARMLGSVQIPSHRLLHGFVQPSSFRASPQQIAWKQVSLTVGEGG